MRTNNNYENNEIKTNEKEKRSLMYSQIFNYNMMNRDHMMRPVDVSAAVESGGKDIDNKKARLIALAILGGFAAFIMLVKFIAGFIGTLPIG